MEEPEEKWSMDWRVAMGLVVTTAWITTGLIYLLAVVGLGAFVHLPTADIGSFLEGAFAPLAFLWLVIGHFMQQQEISSNTKAINIQEMSARRLEVHSRRDSYFKLLTLVQAQLGAVASFHYVSVCGPSGSGEITQEEWTDQRSHASSGDSSWFVSKMIVLAMSNREDGDCLCDIFFGTEIRTRHTNNYQRTFGKLLKAAIAVDEDDMLSDALLYGSAYGMLYRIIRHVRGEELLDPVMGLSEPGQRTPLMETSVEQA